MSGANPRSWALVAMGGAILWVLLLAVEMSVDGDLSGNRRSQTELSHDQVSKAHTQAVRSMRTAEPPSGAGSLRRAGAAVSAVVLRDAATGAPIADAAVQGIRDSFWAVETAAAQEADVVSVARTDSSGRCLLRWREEALPSRLIASASGYRPAESLLDGCPPPELRLDLHQGMVIQGRVVDRIGNPVAGLEIGCVSSTVPVSEGAWSARVPVAGRQGVVVATRSDGSFSVSGLAAGAYRLRVLSDGWILDGRYKGANRTRSRGATACLARAGDRSVWLKVAPVRMFRVRLLREDSGGPVASTVVTLQPRLDGQAVGSGLASFRPPVRAVWSSAEREPVPVLSHEEEPGHWTGCVILEHADQLDGKAELVVRATGFRTGLATIKLVRPREMAAGRHRADVIRLSPERIEDVGALHVDCRRELPGVWRPRMRILSGCRLSDQREFHLRGRHVGQDVWEFTGVPTGVAHVRVFDGCSMSEPTEVRVGTETRSLAVHFAAPTGVVFRLRDSKGRRLYDADVVLLLPPGRGRGPNLDRLTAFRANRVGGLDVAHAVPPGIYRYVVAKGGCGRSTGEVRVAPGQLHRITCVLRP